MILFLLTFFMIDRVAKYRCSALFYVCQTMSLAFSAAHCPDLPRVDSSVAIGNWNGKRFPQQRIKNSGSGPLPFPAQPRGLALPTRAKLIVRIVASLLITP